MPISWPPKPQCRWICHTWSVWVIDHHEKSRTVSRPPPRSDCPLRPGHLHLAPRRRVAPVARDGSALAAPRTTSRAEIGRSGILCCLCRSVSCVSLVGVIRESRRGKSVFRHGTETWAFFLFRCFTLDHVGVGNQRVLEGIRGLGWADSETPEVAGQYGLLISNYPSKLNWTFSSYIVGERSPRVYIRPFWKVALSMYQRAVGVSASRVHIPRSAAPATSKAPPKRSSLNSVLGVMTWVRSCWNNTSIDHRPR